MRSRNAAPVRPEGVSDKDWRLFLGNQLIDTPENPISFDNPVKLDMAERQSPWWRQVETALASDWPDYVEVERLIDLAVSDDYNRTAEQGKLLGSLKAELPVVRAPSRSLADAVWSVARDVALFFGGLSLVIYEAAIAHAEQPTLLILAAAMMGLPVFLRAPDKS